jgi:hypothetical protein
MKFLISSNKRTFLKAFKDPQAPENRLKPKGRPPADLVARLNQEIAVERLVAAHGVELRRDGARIRGVCPFHPDDGRSLVIDSKKNTWRCESGCAAGGSAVDWVQKARGFSKHWAADCARVEQLSNQKSTAAASLHGAHLGLTGARRAPLSPSKHSQEAESSTHSCR